MLVATMSCGGSGDANIEMAGDFLPPDTTSDTLRTADYYYMQLPGDSSGDQPRNIYTFNFASLLETTVDLDIKIYNVVGRSNSELEKLKRENRQVELLLHEPVAATVIIRNDREKKPIFVGRSDAAGKLKAKIALQPGFDEVTL